MRSHGRHTKVAARGLLLFVVSCVCGAGAFELFPYTMHQTLLTGDEVTSTVSMTTPFVFFQQSYSEINVSACLIVYYACGMVLLIHILITN